MHEIAMRSRWTTRDAQTVFAAWEESNLPAAEFAGKHGFDPQRLYWWRRRLGDGGPEKRGAFTELVVRDRDRVIDRADSRVEIIFPSGITVRLGAPIDESVVGGVLKIVREAGEC